MEVIIKQNAHQRLRVRAQDIDVAILVAASLGWSLDYEPGVPGKAKLTATNNRSEVTLTASGSSMNEAARNLINLLTDT